MQIVTLTLLGAITEWRRNVFPHMLWTEQHELSSRDLISVFVRGKKTVTCRAAR